MKLEKQYCSREQAIKLKELGVLNSVTHKTEPDKDGDIYDTATVGTFYSCEVRGDIITGIIGEQEDAPYSNYKPIKHYSITELGAMIGKGTKAAELHWQWLLDCVNSGLSGTVAYNPVALAGHIITQLENETLSAETCNKGLVE